MMSLAIYNQFHLDDETFIDNFVARDETLQMIVNSLRHTAAGGETEHQILIGMRGMGKTSMLRRIALAISNDVVLRAALVPLRFREEQYNVISLDAFWRNCGEALAEWCEQNGRDAMAGRIDRAVATQDWRDPDKALAGFLAFCREIGQRPCLLIDNLDLILDNLGERGWALRNALQREDGPVVVGAATQYLRQAGAREEPFYEFFHPVLLEPLSERELMQCMRALADRRGEAGKPVKDVLTRSPERIRALYTLTGGNPRVLTLIYRLLEQAEGDQILDDLTSLLDEVTPFYKARIEEFQASQQRAIIDAIALHWDPITSGALSKATDIPVTTISSQLNRLRQSGFIQQVETSGSQAGYQLGERFLNIWYLMRHGTRRTRQRLRWLTIFLTRLFNEEELGRMASRAEASGWREDFCLSIREALDEFKANAPMAESAERQGLPLEAFPPAEAIKALGDRGPDVTVAAGMYDDALSSWKAGKEAEAIALWSKLAECFGDSPVPDIQTIVARALLSKGLRFGQLNRSDEAIAIYEEIINRFGKSDLPSLQEQVARALVNKGARLSRLKHSERAITTYDEVLARFGKSDQPALQERVAKALVNKGAALGRLGRREEEVAAYDEVITRFGESLLPTLEECVARALVNKGISLSEQERSDAIAAYEQVITRFGASDSPALQEEVARALVCKGITLGELDSGEEELATYDEVIARFGTSDQPYLQEAVASALVNKGFRLVRQDRGEEAIAAYDELIARFGMSDHDALQEEVARALINKGFMLGRLDRSDEAIAAYDEVITRFGASALPALQECVAGALVSKGVRLGRMKRAEEAIATYDEAIARFGASDRPALQEEIARALVSKGFRLGELERVDEEIATYDEVVTRFGASDRPALQERVARALVNKGIALGQLFRGDEAIAAYDDLIQRFSESPPEYLLDELADALGAKGWLLMDHWDHYIEAEVCYRKAIEIRPDHADRANLVWALIGQGRAEDAEAVADRISDVSSEGRELMTAGIELTRDNLGNAFAHLAQALDIDIQDGRSPHFEGIIWLLRIGVDRGHGEKLIQWFVESDNSERYGPIYWALLAYVRGAHLLRDLNPEARGVAERLYARMSAPRRHREGTAPTRAKRKRRT